MKKRFSPEPNLTDDTPPPMPADFKAGWDAGYYDGGEHDCRMFRPTAKSAWETEWLQRERAKRKVGAPR